MESESAKGSESERRGEWTLRASEGGGRGKNDAWRSGLEVFEVAVMGRMVAADDMTINLAGARPVR